MAEPQIHTVSLRRMDTSQPWGFRMRGGAQQGMPLFVEHVGPNGRAAHAGLAAGDVILMICRTNVQGFTHDQAKGEMLRAGNELDFTVQRGAMAGRAPPPAAQQDRVQVVEEPTCRLGGPTYKQVKPKTYKVLEDQLPDQGPAPGRPASIFDRKRQERSGYLQAKGPTIQKAYGQTH